MKNFQKKIIIFSLVLFSFSSILTAQVANIENLLSSEYINELKNNGRIQVIHEKEDKNLTLIPKNVYEEKIRSESIYKDPKMVPFVAEFLYLIPKSELLKNSSKEDITVDDVAVVMRSISKMKGLKYIHGFKNKEDLLYSDAYMIANPDSDEPIPDQNTGNADGQVSYCYQHDHTYGDTKYVLNYHQKDSAILGTFVNTLPLQALGVKVIMPNNMKICIEAIDCGENLLLYLSTDCNAKNIALINVRNQIEDSMLSRMNAIYNWFLNQF